MAVQRRGKYLVMKLDGTDALVVHLGMSGQLLRAKTAREKAPKHTHVVITFTQGGLLRFVDPRTFGEMFVDAVRRDRPAGRGARAPRSRPARDRALVGPVRPHARRAQDQAEAAADGPEVHRRDRQRLQRRDPVRGRASSGSGRATRSRSRRSGACTGRSARRSTARSSTAARRSPTRGTSTCSASPASTRTTTRCTAARAQACMRCRRPIHRARYSNRSTFYCDACQV